MVAAIAIERMMACGGGHAALSNAFKSNPFADIKKSRVSNKNKCHVASLLLLCIIISPVGLHSYESKGKLREEGSFATTGAGRRGSSSSTTKQAT